MHDIHLAVHHLTPWALNLLQALLRFTAHLQQLDMESNGKHIGQFCHFSQHMIGCACPCD